MQEQMYAEVELSNGTDVMMRRRGVIEQDTIRRITVNARVVKKGLILTINELTQEVLKLPVTGRQMLQIENGRLCEFDVAGPVEVQYKSRRNSCNAVIIPGSLNVTISEGHLQLLEAEIMLIPPIRPILDDSAF